MTRHGICVIFGTGQKSAVTVAASFNSNKLTGRQMVLTPALNSR